MVGRAGRRPPWLIARFAPMLPYETQAGAYSAPAVHEDRRAALRRRMTDKVETTLHLACAVGDLPVASRLLGVLEALQERSHRRVRTERRAASLAVARGRRTIHALAAAQAAAGAASTG